jgi:hypothetical protein
MRRFDVCNGDADGLCAAVQWRLHEPDADALLVTGLKREIALLDRVLPLARAGDEVQVFDVSMQRNQPALRQLLDRGVAVRYVDHHACGEIPVHPLLEAHVDLGSEVCTSVLVDQLLRGRYRHWALVGAYGDNLARVADRLALEGGLDEASRAALRALGEGINYNAYGESGRDQHIAPGALQAIMLRHADPLDMAAQEPIVRELDALRRADLQRARSLAPHWQCDGGRVWLLPDEVWARRVMGVWANELAQDRPDLAHAVLRRQADGSHVVSVRAPLALPGGAAGLCQAFGGNGRARAAGIDALPEASLGAFIDAFEATRWGQ